MSNDTSQTQSTVEEEQQEQTEERTPQQATQKILEKQAGLNLGILGTAVQSLRRGLAWEHNMVEGEGKEGDLGPNPTEEDDMGNLVVGDVSFNESTTQPDNSDQTNALFELTKMALQGGAKTAPVAATGISPWWLAIPTALALLTGGFSAYQAIQEPSPSPEIEQPAEPQESTTILNQDGTKYQMEFAEPVTRLPNE